ncbi:MAG TPA: hypothetical protein VND40_02310 [Nitrososphaerales archaeon]|nr:hypothetical protein [Nitrososphaerales archaeon]
MATPSGEGPVASFVLSLIAGLLVLAGGALVTSFSSGLPQYGGMMGGYYYGGLTGGYYGMMRGFGFGGGWFYGLAALGVVSGIVILVGAVMIYNQPTKASTWGAIVFAFSIASLFGMGGFFFGSILGVVGGVLAIVWKPGA